MPKNDRLPYVHQHQNYQESNATVHTHVIN